MTILIDKSERDNIGIDCLEKALLYAVFMLKDRIAINEAIYPQNMANIQWAFQQFPSTKYGVITISCQLAHYRELAFKSGGRFPEKIKIFSGGVTDPYLGDTEPSVGIEQEPPWVETLEHYLSWVIHKLVSKLLIQEKHDKFAITYADQFMSFQTNLYIDFLEYTQNYKNYIHCVIPFDQWDLLINNGQIISDGVLGYTLRWRDQWQADQSYIVNDIVFYDFISYIALEDNTNSQPDLLEKWAIFFAGATGPQGGQGLSAYQIWLSQGNVGTEADFLASLKGADGIIGVNGQSAYQIWLGQGNTGTEADFLASLKGADGIIGVNGQSAYQIWIAQGNVGTEADFLASLKGLKGDPGPVSVSVDPSPITLAAGQSVAVQNVGTTSDLILKFSIPQGLTGDTGLSAYQIWLAQGNSGTVSDFLASLKGETGAIGPQGLTGDTGLSAYQIWLAQGNSGTVSDFLASLKGIKGDTGAAGSVNAASFLGLNYQISDPSPVTDQVLIYAKSDGKLYQLPPTGSPSLIGSGATGSGASVNDIWLYGGI